ncbi:MAG: UDP-4-amino-4,6-dideoxy-N-acetyl-beta-L-altrosamine transaminase [bacterium]|nr:UDP-4-amino-4,6-dideoxy-N-acetyl-beta-L-altrosamine transaminase [bacterium]
MEQFLSYGKQWLEDDDIAAVVNVLKSDYLTQGPQVSHFETQLAAYLGAKYVVAVANGTAALHLAVKALNLEKSSTGITSPITFAASANCFLYNGLKPAFADIDEKTYCIDPAQLANTEADVIIPVHFAGQPCEMKQIYETAAKKPTRPYIIEDACHAIGSTYENGKKVGSCCYSDMTVFSFHPVKTIATGEGGVITTNNEELYEKLILLRSHGITKDSSKFKANRQAPAIENTDWNGPWYYEMQELGFNYRLTDMQAALGVSQLKKIDGFVKKRRSIIDTYNSAFQNREWLTEPFERENLSSAFHLYVLKIDFEKIGKTRTQVMGELREKGIGTQVHYIPVHLQPYYRENYGYKEGDYPRAEHYYKQCLSIPLYPKMTEENIQRVINAIIGLNT